MLSSPMDCIRICNKRVPFKARKVKCYLPQWIASEYKDLSHCRDYLKRKPQLSKDPNDSETSKSNAEPGKFPQPQTQKGAFLQSGKGEY